MQDCNMAAGVQTGWY